MHAFGGNRLHGRDGVGLEVEATPIVVRDGRRCVADIAHVLAWLESIGEGRGWDFSRVTDLSPVVSVSDGGIITLEPGGQIEYSSRTCDDAATALDEVEEFLALLEERSADAGIELRFAGFNDACAIDDIPLQLSAPRYREMDEYFASISPYGREMMRATCALQISLDFGQGSIAAERWRLANMIAPAMNALFANSPHERDGRRYRSYRQEIWRHVDPSRTGRLFDEPDLDPVADYLRFALDARVMLIRTGDRDMRRPAMPLTFRQWMDGFANVDELVDSRAQARADEQARGFPDRAPDIADWELHLTTLFPDVRARGFMELRSIDAQPAATRRIAAELVTALIYDGALRIEALRRLESRQRTRRPDEHEHDGYWQSDLATGRELLTLALERIDARTHAAAERHLAMLEA